MDYKYKGLIERRQKQKDEYRRGQEEKNWRQAVIGDRRKYSCKTCFHRKAKCCTGLSKLSKICKYWFRPGSDIQGLLMRG